MRRFRVLRHAWPVGRHREVLDGLPDDLPVRVDTAEQRSGVAGAPQVMIAAGRRPLRGAAVAGPPRPAALTSP